MCYVQLYMQQLCSQRKCFSHNVDMNNIVILYIYLFNIMAMHMLTADAGVACG